MEGIVEIYEIIDTPCKPSSPPPVLSNDFLRLLIGGGGKKYNIDWLYQTVLRYKPNPNKKESDLIEKCRRKGYNDVLGALIAQFEVERRWNSIGRPKIPYNADQFESIFGRPPESKDYQRSMVVDDSEDTE